MTIQFRNCQPSDVNEVIPLMYSAGPEAFRYVFSVDYQDQVIDFLYFAFCQGNGEFGYKDHQVGISNNNIVALVGRRSPKDNFSYTLTAIKQIFSFYGTFKGLKVILRGLRFEAIVTPPTKHVICLHNLAVADEQQGNGIGQQVIQHFIEQERLKGTSTVCLDVAETNPRAKVLYQRLGFVERHKRIGKLKNTYGRGVSHEHMEVTI